MGFLHAHGDACPVRDGALPKIPQHIGMEEDVGRCTVGNYETKTFCRIKPLHTTLHHLRGLFFFSHFKSYLPVCPFSDVRFGTDGRKG